MACQLFLSESLWSDLVSGNTEANQRTVMPPRAKSNSVSGKWALPLKVIGVHVYGLVWIHEMALVKFQ